eukprot:PLAT14593.1.p1 GENE.PLAT14593.1~~PLAT14593.1.p1  ORF type:complete len:823 (-),score=123.65 PLAT14593.1:1162-3630(-)
MASVSIQPGARQPTEHERTEIHYPLDQELALKEYQSELRATPLWNALQLGNAADLRKSLSLGLFGKHHAWPARLLRLAIMYCIYTANAELIELLLEAETDGVLGVEDGLNYPPLVHMAAVGTSTNCLVVLFHALPPAEYEVSLLAAALIANRTQHLPFLAKYRRAWTSIRQWGHPLYWAVRQDQKDDLAVVLESRFFTDSCRLEVLKWSSSDWLNGLVLDSLTMSVEVVEQARQDDDARDAGAPPSPPIFSHGQRIITSKQLHFFDRTYFSGVKEAVLLRGLRLDCHVQAPDDNQLWPPLAYALAFNLSSRVSGYLLDLGADPNQPAPDGRSPLELAMQGRATSSVVEALVRKGGMIGGLAEPRLPDVLRLLVDEKLYLLRAFPAYPIQWTPEDFTDDLCAVIKRTSKPRRVLLALLSRGIWPVARCDLEQELLLRTLLQCIHGCREHRPQLQHVYNNSLHVDLRRFSPSLLAKLSARVALEPERIDGQALLHYLVEKRGGELAFQRWLPTCLAAGADVHADYRGVPLLCAVAIMDVPKAVSLCVAAGADIAAAAVEGSRALHFAKSERMVEKLLAAGADAAAVNEAGESAADVMLATNRLHALGALARAVDVCVLLGDKLPALLNSALEKHDTALLAVLLQAMGPAALGCDAFVQGVNDSCSTAVALLVITHCMSDDGDVPPIFTADCLQLTVEYALIEKLGNAVLYRRLTRLAAAAAVAAPLPSDTDELLLWLGLQACEHEDCAAVYGIVPFPSHDFDDDETDSNQSDDEEGDADDGFDDDYFVYDGDADSDSDFEFMDHGVELMVGDDGAPILVGAPGW